MVFKKMDKSSVDTVTSALDLFTTPVTQVAVEKVIEKEILTLNPVSDPPFHFRITPGSSLVNLNSAYLITEMKLWKRDVGKTDWVVCTTDDNISVIQGIGANYIRNMKINVAGQQIFNANNLYGYKSNLDTELSYDRSMKESMLNATGYYYDDTGYPKGFYEKEVTDAGGAKRKENVYTLPFKKRRDRFTNGKTAQFRTPLHADIFRQDRYFLNHTDIEVEIEPYHSKFLVHASHYTGEVRVEFVSCKMYVKFVDLHPGFLLDLERELDKHPARYPLRRTELKTLFFESGRTEAHYHLFSDMIPRRVVCAFVSKSDYNGDQATNPFNYQHYNMRDVRVEWNGLQCPTVDYDMDFANKRYVRAFSDLYTALGYANSTSGGCGITYDMYAFGYTIYVFNTTSAQDDSEAFDFVRDGSTALHSRLNNEIPAGGAYAVIYAEFDSLMFIDKTRMAKTDMTV